MHKKYQLILDIHLGSISFVMTPACSMLLNLIVIGKGSLMITKPLKKALIQLMIRVFGIIMAMLFFIMPIIPSITLGSVMGFAGG
ncbi:hypothetical protein RRF57_008788 [Xylaria bambusicola]|uniref:Uncharacterized protein n=1 Tax=Xylaria bambusicola TaxID=326684 RepID=A0AAN7UYK6_9PEZI